ncbi:hypothetical protein MUK42_26207, partial [Musa troglodytarum]
WHPPAWLGRLEASCSPPVFLRLPPPTHPHVPPASSPSPGPVENWWFEPKRRRHRRRQRRQRWKLPSRRRQLVPREMQRCMAACVYILCS